MKKIIYKDEIFEFYAIKEGDKYYELRKGPEIETRISEITLLQFAKFVNARVIDNYLDFYTNDEGFVKVKLRDEEVNELLKDPVIEDNSLDINTLFPEAEDWELEIKDLTEEERKVLNTNVCGVEEIIEEVKLKSLFDDETLV